LKDWRESKQKGAQGIDAIKRVGVQHHEERGINTTVRLGRRNLA